MTTSIETQDSDDVPLCPDCLVPFEGSPDLGYFCPCCFVDLDFIRNRYEG